VDQAELQGFLNRLHALGLEVVEVRKVPTVSERPAATDDDT
jgi:hypothetical protein